ncbi:Hypothetical_protein [Hexamita inflata]|uniref:Hypothetical_protein n=1 Tax=Hexamita inflata TaxID=28002 RepID=A0AA86P091_9EUKA|nr:Hypothetical protein HINF_LOCUS17059 [Hexamita inflata]
MKVGQQITIKKKNVAGSDTTFSWFLWCLIINSKCNQGSLCASFKSQKFYENWDGFITNGRLLGIVSFQGASETLITKRSRQFSRSCTKQLRQNKFTKEINLQNFVSVQLYRESKRTVKNDLKEWFESGNRRL